MTLEDQNEGGGGRVLNFDHLVFWVANSKAVANYFITRLGFEPLAVRETTEERPILSYAVILNKIKLVFESPTKKDDSTITQDIEVHGDFVKDVAFSVQDLDELVRRATKAGAEVITPISEETDNGGSVRYAVLRTYGNTNHTLLDRSNYKGLFLPGFKAVEGGDVINKFLPDTLLEYIDHVEGNMADGTLEESVTWYQKNLNMHRFWCVDYSHDLRPYSGIQSGSVINQDDTVLLSMNESAKGIKAGSKATEFVKALGAPGVEHIALYTSDIVTTMRTLKARGAEILVPPPTYYSIIKEKLKGSSVKVMESLESLEQNHIFIDFDERGYMLQAFTKHLQARPTVFVEVISRRNHRGFGAQNYKWVFEAIELLETTKEKKPKDKNEE